MPHTTNLWRGPDFRSENTSNAELDILLALQRRRLNIHLHTQYPFYFSMTHDVVPFTCIDFYWDHPRRISVAVFLDGERVHRSTHQRMKDQQIDEQLTYRKVVVRRFTYRTPLSKSRRNDIVDQIEQALKSNGY